MLETASIEFMIENFKSYFGDPLKLMTKKPITLIVGPNGEGKTNLLQAMLIALAEFTRRYPKIRSRSLFTRKVRVSKRVSTSLGDAVMYNLLKGGGADYKDVFTPQAVISHGHKHCTVGFSVRRPRKGRKGEVTLAQCNVRVSGSPPDYSIGKRERKIDNLELVYLSPEGSSINVFVKLIGQEFFRLIRGKRGQVAANAFFREVMNAFPFDDKRLIKDIEDGKFNEAYSDSRLFLTNGLATGAKKELLIYSIGIIMERNKEIDDWLAVLLVDELGQGLHLSRQTEMANALADILERDDVKNHVRLIATTHSPLIYSEIIKRNDVADVYFVLREKGCTSQVAKWGEGDDKMIEKMLTTKLWLNICALPEKLVFVEGKTDKLFFDRALNQISDMEIFKLRGPSIPNVLLDLLKKLPLARQREYFAIGDETGMETLRVGAKELEEEGGHLEVINIGFDSLEEFILGIPKELEETKLWDRMTDRFENLAKKAEDLGSKLPQIDVTKARTRLESNGREGIDHFLDALKKESLLYETVGEYWKQLLPETSHRQLESIIKRIQGSGS